MSHTHSECCAQYRAASLGPSGTIAAVRLLPALSTAAPPTRSPDRPQPPRPLVWWGLAGLVLGAHTVLLQPWRPEAASAPGGVGSPRGPVGALQVRTVRVEPTDSPAAPPAARAPAPPVQPSSPPATVGTEAAAAEPLARHAAPPFPRLPEATDEEPSASPGTAMTTLDFSTWPVYATALPGPVTLRYAWRRGNTQGQSALRFEREGEGYRLSLDQQVDGQARRGSTSQGRVDAHGLAPERLAERRKDRELRAANFRRDQGRITFSGPTTEAPLLDGAQDRLSWLMQLAGILEANPALRQAGRQVQLFVAGTRGDAEVWRCEVIGREDLDLPGGPVRGALHLRREPTRPRDLTVDVWLDPARQHLPVRLLQKLGPQGPGSEWLLLEVQGVARP